jgi:hypothetical protein
MSLFFMPCASIAFISAISLFVMLRLAKSLAQLFAGG